MLTETPSFRMKIVSYLLTGLTAFYPLHPAIGAGISVAGNQTQVIQQGQVPVINIATPNAAGVSHNQYQDFNVAPTGAVLNNAVSSMTSQLAGQMSANGNLKDKSADLIINEVISGNASSLQGKLEVAGQKANILIANPNGITCDGCGFINSPAVTLSTGKPVFDKQGALEALEVKKGAVTIGDKGWDAKAQDYVDILSQATVLNGKIQAKNLSLTQGTNRIDLKQGSVTPIKGDSQIPKLAVDTKALGGMYANKIRLVATENGVGVNLANIVTDQKDITMTVDGNVSLGDINAKTDLNISSKAIEVNKSNINAGRDITLATDTLKNPGKIVAGKDMRLFADTVTNQGGNALIQANDNLWIQKEASGALSTLVDNISGTIKTNKGDVIIRSAALYNRPENLNFHTEEVTGENKKALLSKVSKENLPPYIDEKLVPIKIDPDRTTITKATIKSHIPHAVISSGKNAYLRANRIENYQSNIEAKQNIILTGGRFYNQIWSDHLSISTPLSFSSDKKEIERIRINDGTYSGKIIAGKNLVLDFNDIIAFSLYKKIPPPKPVNIVSKKNIDVATAQNILIKSKSIILKERFKANQDISIIGDSIGLYQGTFHAGNNLAITSGNEITIRDGHLKGKNISLLARTGDMLIYNDIYRFYGSDKKLQFSEISAQEKLDIFAGKMIYLNGAALEKNGQISLTAGTDIKMVKHETPLTFPLLGAKLPIDDTHIKKIGLWESAGDITLSAGRYVLLFGMSLTSDKAITIGAGQNIRIIPRPFEHRDDDTFKFQRRPEMRPQLTAKENITLTAGRDITLRGATANAANQTTVVAGRNIEIDAVPYSVIPNPTQNPRDDRHWGADIQGGKGLTLAANGALRVQGSKLHSAGDITLSSNGNMRFESVRNTYINDSTENHTQQSTELSSGANLKVISNGSILFQATKLAAKGGFIYAQAMEEFYRWEEKKKRCKGRFGIGGWCPLGKKTITKHRASSTNKVTEFTAGGDITLMARDDITLEATKVNTQKNAKLTSQKGKINFKAVNNTAFEQTITDSTGFFITHQDKGFVENRWVLPRLHLGGKLALEAANGLSAEVKVKEGQSFEQAVAQLSHTRGYEWLNEIKNNKNVNWTVVKEAYSQWDKKSEHLNPVVSAVIAIAVAAATYGTSAAASIGGLVNSVATTTGATTTAIASASAQAGFAALASQAAVALMENKGNLSKTLSALGKSDNVKSLVTSMAMAGAFQGFDMALYGKATDPAIVSLPQLSHGDWSQAAQRVAGQSVISATLGTAIQGGSFTDTRVSHRHIKFQKWLKSND